MYTIFQVKENWDKSGNHDSDECDGVWFGNGGRGDGQASAAGFINRQDPGLMAAYWLYITKVAEDNFNILRTLPEDQQMEIGAPPNPRNGAGAAAPASVASTTRARKRVREDGGAGSVVAAAEAIAKAIKDAGSLFHSQPQPTDFDAARAALLRERTMAAQEERLLRRLQLYLQKSNDPDLSDHEQEEYKKRADYIQGLLDAEDGYGREHHD
jgi:hypothetical protein